MKKIKEIVILQKSKSTIFSKLFSLFVSSSGSSKKSLQEKIEEETYKDLVELEVLKNKKLLLTLQEENSKLKSQNQKLLIVIDETHSLIQNILKDRQLTIKKLNIKNSKL